MNANMKPTGEPETDFEKGGSKGPFECGNCVHMEAGVCHHPIMVAVSKQPRRKGLPVVGEHDCCRFVRRKGDGS